MLLGPTRQCSELRWNKFDRWLWQQKYFNTVLNIGFLSRPYPTWKMNGKKFIMVDNLSSHINEKVIKACQGNSISFICLPLKSTHLTQSLHTAFFRSMKSQWKVLFTQWKRNEPTKKELLLPKDIFLQYLKKLHDKMADNAANNLKSGFHKRLTLPCQQIL